MFEKQILVVPSEWKALDGGEPGMFEGYASVAGIEDLHGDIVEPYAFAKTIQERGDRVPLLWQHEQKQPIGLGTIRETPRGLHVRGRLTLGVARADETYALLRAGVLTGLSIGYDALKKHRDSNGVRRLTELRLHEISVVTFPANEQARISDVKARGAESQTDAALVDLVGDVLRLAADARLRATVRDLTRCSAKRATAISLQTAANRIQRLAGQFHTPVSGGQQR